MTYKLVQFKDGRFGGRKGFFNYRYLDMLEPVRFQWYGTEAVNKWGKGTQEQAVKAIEAYNKNSDNDKGTLV